MGTLSRALAESEAEKIDIQEMSTISIQSTRAEAEATIRASNQLVEILLREARARPAASGSTQQANTNITGIHKDCSFYYSSGPSTGAKVMHANENCGHYQYTYEVNRAIARPCRRCMNLGLPVGP